MIKRLSSFLLMLLVAQLVVAQAPSGYYDNAKGKSGKGLKTALWGVIQNPSVVSYDGLWEAFKKTDKRADGKVWDMYSNTTSYTLGGSKQGANYKKEGDSYNREHSFPKSWFGGKVKPMYSDLFHLYPTDGYINNRRSSFPFGETEGEIYSSANGWSKVGGCTVPGYSGTVFEPNDEYKGDFARTYFYMATAYEDKIAGWNSPMLSHDKYTAYASWALDMLLRWAKEDPVSQKEIDRNNAVYKIQKNRNPYIDYPGLEQYVWGDKTSITFDPDNFVPEGGGEVGPNPGPNPTPDPGVTVAVPTFSVPAGKVMAGTEVTVSCSTTGASVYYTVNGGDLQVNYGTATLTISETSTIEAYAMVGESTSDTIRATYIVEKVPEGQGNLYAKVYKAEDLVVGGKYLIVYEDGNMAMAGIAGYNNDVRDTASVTIVDKEIRTMVSQQGYPTALTLNKDDQGYTFYDEVTQTYLAVELNKNHLPSISHSDKLGAHWTVSWFQGNTLIANAEFTGRTIGFNTDAYRFSTYESKFMNVALYKEISEVVPDQNKVAAPQFSIAGGEVRKGTPVNISCTTPGAMIHYTIDGGAEQQHLSPVVLTIEQNTTISAYAKVGEKQSETVTISYTVASAPAVGDGAYIKVTSAADLTAGSRYLIVCESKNTALGAAEGKYMDYRRAVNVDITGGVIQSEVSSADYPYALTLGGDETGYTLYDAASDAYLGLVKEEDNKLNNLATAEEEGAHWRITFEDGTAVIRNVKFDVRTIRYNYSSPRFSTYKQGQGAVTLFKEYKKDSVAGVAAPVFSEPSGDIAEGTTVLISCPTEGAEIYYRVNGGDFQHHKGLVALVIKENAEIETYAQLGDVCSETVKVVYTITKPEPTKKGLFIKASDAKALLPGYKYLIVCEELETALSAPTGKELDIRSAADVTITDNVIISPVAEPSYPYALTLGSSPEGYTFYDEATNGYLAFTGKSNRLPNVTDVTGNEALWTISFTGGSVEIRSVKDNNRMIMYNNDQPRFVAYTADSQQYPVSLFVEEPPTGIDCLENADGTVDVYTLDGRLLRDDVRKEDAVKGLSRGFYIVGGVKVMIR